MSIIFATSPLVGETRVALRLPLKNTLYEVERVLILHTLACCAGVRIHAARILGYNTDGFSQKLRRVSKSILEERREDVCNRWIARAVRRERRNAA